MTTEIQRSIRELARPFSRDSYLAKDFSYLELKNGRGISGMYLQLSRIPDIIALAGLAAVYRLDGFVEAVLNKDKKKTG
jgi:hypothetical protein